MDLTPHDTLTFAPTVHEGRPAWLASDGRIIPRIAGGDGSAEGGEGGGEGGGGTGGEGGEGGSGQGSGSGESGGEGGEGGNEPQLTPEQQAIVDAQVTKQVGAAMAKKLEAERKKWETEASEKAKRAQMDEAERLKAEKADAEKAANDAVAKANARLVLADAKVAAVTAGVKADRVDKFLRLVELDDINVDDDGTIDTKAIEKAVKATLDDLPEFKATGSGRSGSSGGEFGGNNGGTKPANLEDAVTARLGA